jgi:hypothetical protein
MGAVAGRLTVDRKNELSGGRDPGELGDLGFGLTGVDKDVEAMGGSEPWKRGFGTTARGCSSQHESTRDADKGGKHHP